MTLLKRALNYFVTRYQRPIFEESVRAILETPVVSAGDMPFTALSMVHKRDVLPYLVALKSFAQYARPREVVVVCDPSIGEPERDLLRRHIPHVVLLRADDFTHPDIPRGGCWERLFAIASMADTRYIVQLDADTVTTGPLDEVAAAVAAGTAFVLGEEANQRIMTLAEASANQNPQNTPESERNHIQAVSEVALPHVGLPEDHRYVRGCAAFTGFPADPAMRDRMIEFSSRMKAKLGARWSEWGTEQVTSNYLVANANGVRILPFPAYCTPFQKFEGVKFWHFMGSVRFTDGRYSSRVRQAVAHLRS